MPNEFDPEVALGLAANIPAVEAAQQLCMARSIAIALGDSKTLADAVFLTTGNDRLAQRVEVAAQMRKASNG